MARTLVQFTCPECGGTGAQEPSVMRRAPVHYCSISCALAARNRRTAGPKPHLRKRVTLTCPECGHEFETFPAWVRKGQRFCSPSCATASNTKNGTTRGERNGHWKGGTSIKNGYHRIHSADGHHVLEHRAIVAAPDGMVVHHINGDRADNRPENLLTLTNAEHARLHAKERGGSPGRLCATPGCGRRVRMARDGTRHDRCHTCRKG